jgi:hypothetical protein
VKIKKKNLKNIFLVKTVMKVLYVQIIHNTYMCRKNSSFYREFNEKLCEEFRPKTQLRNLKYQEFN